MSTNGENQSRMGRLVDASLMLFVGFLLTSIAGGLLGYYFQERSWQNEHRAQLAESERARATEFFDHLSRLMDRRLYAMRMLHTKDAVSSNAASWDAYRDVLHAWNEELNRNIAMTERYFGNQTRGAFERIHYSLRDVGASLTAGRSGRTQVNFADLSRQLDQTNNEICELDNTMIRAIQQARVGVFIEMPTE